MLALPFVFGFVFAPPALADPLGGTAAAAAGPIDVAAATVSDDDDDVCGGDVADFLPNMFLIAFPAAVAAAAAVLLAADTPVSSSPELPLSLSSLSLIVDCVWFESCATSSSPSSAMKRNAQPQERVSV